MSQLEARLQAVQAERRANARFQVEYPAKFRTISTERRGRVVNVSLHGARIEFDHDEPPPMGLSGMLMFEGVEKFCQVVWRDERACGVEFEREMLPDIFKEIVGVEAPENTGPVARAINIPLGRKRNRLVAGG